MRRAKQRSAGRADTGTAIETPAQSPAVRALAYRDGLLAAVTPEDITEIGRALVQRAKTGDPAAAKLVLDRLCGTQSVPAWETPEEIAGKDALRSMMGGFGV